ncbi:MAG: PepSY domain-containing protein, partial [Candidatus Caldarchaeum sp.]
PPSGQRISMQQAVEIFERYVTGLGQGFKLKEVMEFQRNFYAIVVETDTGIGAFELLVNPYTGAVYPEPGPNMMWNTKYGMHQGMMGPYIQPTADMPITPEQAEEIALNYLRNIFRGAVEVEHPTKFYGYYTMDYKVDGKVDGMLSVNGFTGQVWYHGWHGQFIQETEMEEE